ncbi:MAG: glycosyltransferase [Shimia thalassica]|uniref:glycosyltransferase n=1 Tax=Shimia thalassica TaxID=1715693 RepID=UPI00329A49E5
MNNPSSKQQFSEAALPFQRPQSVAQILQSHSSVSPKAMLGAHRQLDLWDATLGEILVSEGAIGSDAYSKAFAQAEGYDFVSLETAPAPSPTLRSLLAPGFCLKHNVLAWRQNTDGVVLMTGRPERIAALRDALPASLQRAKIVVASEDAVTSILRDLYREELVAQAEARPNTEYSCRPSSAHTLSHRMLCACLLVLITAIILAPKASFLALLGWVLIAQCAIFFMKLFATLARAGEQPPPMRVTMKQKLPRISVMVPLFKEHDIAGALIRRLSRLSYPKALLDVLLVLEEHDDITHRTIAKTTLPSWMRVVVVPAGDGLTTKPRALNYALDFCRGDIVGIWDAEDAPAPDQLEKVACHFDSAPQDVACVQGVLDYYNPFTNWISRCFTIEYATWFRIILPGLARLGFAIPLGGTTLFLRREVIETIGGWDAHNVTEDADLGVRLARFGYRTELLPCVTQEEANCRPLPWIKQRSRWLKGYMITYLVHMRRPVRLISEIGGRKFLGLQLIFAATLSQFLLAPLLWLFWGNAIGFTLTGDTLIPRPLSFGVASALSVFGIVNACISLWAVSGLDRPRLYPWVLTMVLYFPLATLAAYKAFYELLFAPYFWDKTAHGKTKEGLDAHHSGVSVLLQAGDESL